jgi:hypothetical protein
MTAVNLDRVPAYYHKYIAKVSANNVNEALETNGKEMISFLKNIPEETWEHSYAPGKWTIKELVQHLIDAERIFSYRALTFARKDTTPLPGFEENDYVSNSHANRRSPGSLLTELEKLRASTISLFDSFNEEQMENEGVANNVSIYVRSIGFIIAGHAIHHIEVIKERYLQPA